MYMQGFSFATSSRILARLGASAQTGLLMRELGCRNVGIVTDKNIRQWGLIDAAVASLDEVGIGCHIYDDVSADPPLESVLDAAAWAKINKVDGIVGFGGGSPLDVAKMVA
eukprot:1586212-Prymnesium_polylepis.1